MIFLRYQKANSVVFCCFDQLWTSLVLNSGEILWSSPSESRFLIDFSSVSSIIVPDDVSGRAARALEYAESQAAVPRHLLGWLRGWVAWLVTFRRGLYNEMLMGYMNIYIYIWYMGSNQGFKHQIWNDMELYWAHSGNSWIISLFWGDSCYRWIHVWEKLHMGLEWLGLIFHKRGRHPFIIIGSIN